MDRPDISGTDPLERARELQHQAGERTAPIFAVLRAQGGALNTRRPARGASNDDFKRWAQHDALIEELSTYQRGDLNAVASGYRSHLAHLERGRAAARQGLIGGLIALASGAILALAQWWFGALWLLGMGAGVALVATLNLPKFPRRRFERLQHQLSALEAAAA